MPFDEEQVRRIQDKLQILLKDYAALQKENEMLRESLQRSEEQAGEYRQSAEALKQQISILQLGTGQMSEADKKEFDKRLNTYIKEIDRCIAMLSE